MRHHADPSQPGDKREFARIPVRIEARLSPLDDERAECLRAELASRPSVWAPSNESTLRDMATSASVTSESILAQAVLELAGQIVRLRSRLNGASGPKRATIVQLSGGGGQLLCELALDPDDLFEICLEDTDDVVPPIRALGRVVHRADETPGCGFRFEAIHAQDEALLMRLIYQIQRRALRENHRHKETGS